MSNVYQYWKLADKIISENVNKDLKYKPLDKVRIINKKKPNYNTIVIIDKVNHYNGLYYVGYNYYNETDLELVERHIY